MTLAPHLRSGFWNVMFKYSKLMKTFKQALQIRRKAVVFDVVAFILFVGVWVSDGFFLGAFVAGFMLFAKTLTIWIHRTRIVSDFAARETTSKAKTR